MWGNREIPRIKSKIKDERLKIKEGKEALRHYGTMAKRDRGAGGTSQRRFEKGLKTKFWSLSTRRRRGIEATDVKIKD